GWTRASSRAGSTASRPSRRPCDGKERRRSRGARARSCASVPRATAGRRAATRPSSTTPTSCGEPGPRSRTRTRASSSSRRPTAGSWRTSAAATTPAGAATARSPPATRSFPCSRSGSRRSSRGSPTSCRRRSRTSASSRRPTSRRAPVSAELARRRRLAMVERQLRRRGIRDERVLDAMARVPRELFVPTELRERAYADAALPIGWGQTISQPYMVALICEELALRGGERVLDVGTGSGYQAAVLAELAGEVHSIERIAGLADRATERLSAAGYGTRVSVHVGDGSRGLPQHAPFAAIAVAAAAPSLPQALYEQLKLRGRLVVPVGGRSEQLLQVIVRTPEGPAVLRTVPCRFVPLVGAEGFDDD